MKKKERDGGFDPSSAGTSVWVWVWAWAWAGGGGGRDEVLQI